MPARQNYDAITDVPGIKVGHWTDRRAATGCTVVLCDKGAVPGVDVRGGAPGTRETDLARPGYSAAAINAVLVTGGSTFGLAAADGVMRWCEEQGIGTLFGGRRIPLVAAAVIFDLNVGRADVRPGPHAGYAAAAAARAGRVAQGSVGAGTGATVAKLMGASRAMKGGIGSASEQLGNGIVIGALFAVNAVGDVYDSATGSLIAGPRGGDGQFLNTMRSLRAAPIEPAPSNTTIGVVATNAKLTKEQANRLASVAHDGLARAVRPVHTAADGDTVFVMATGEVEMASRRMVALEAFAPLAVERAIVKGVLAAKSLAGVASVSDWIAANTGG